MTPPAKTRPPSIPDDNSSVRERSPSHPSIAPPPSGSALATRDRLEAKLRVGREVLASLSAADDRARLLHVAIVRRDEALLDGVLSALGVTTGTLPPPAR
ncbi:MAG TPA: hypothetical protein VGK73_00955 [Polyangiaceae bacterium]